MSKTTTTPSKLQYSSIRRKKDMAALIMGVAAGVIAMVAERADAGLTGGQATPLGYINTYTWLLVAIALTGLRGGIITTEIQAILGLVTFSNPLSWLWIPMNLVFAIVAGATWMAVSKLKFAGLKSKLFVSSVSCALLDIPMVYVVIVLALGLPFVAYIGVLPMYIALQIIPSSILAFFIVKTINRSGILGKSMEPGVKTD